MILSNIIHDPEFANIVLPKLDEKFLTKGPSEEKSKPHIAVFKIIKDQYDKTGEVPSLEALSVLMTQSVKILRDKESIVDIEKVFAKMKTHICAEDSLGFRVNQAQHHCQTVQSQIALIESADIIDRIDSGEDISRSVIIDIMSKVFEIDFNPDLGSGLHENLDEFWDSLHDVHTKIPFGIKPLDDAIAGGLKRHGLTIVVGCTNVGKTALMCDFTARFMQQGRNVLYISKEISEVEVKERVYANILDMPTSIMRNKDKTPKHTFIEKIKPILDSCGRVYVKHDDSNSFNAEDVKILVDGLEKKNSIKFDIVIVDNLSNMSPISMRRNKNVRGDELLVKVAQELKNLSSRIDAHVIAPEQTTLECEYKLHPELSDIANAKGISRVVDNAFMIGVNQEFVEAKMIMVTIRKTRSKNSRGACFRLGFNYSKQKTFEIDEPASSMDTDTVEGVDTSRNSENPLKRLKSKRLIDRETKNAERQDLISI